MVSLMHFKTFRCGYIPSYQYYGITLASVYSLTTVLTKALPQHLTSFIISVKITSRLNLRRANFQNFVEEEHAFVH